MLGILGLGAIFVQMNEIIDCNLCFFFYPPFLPTYGKIGMIFQKPPLSLPSLLSSPKSFKTSMLLSIAEALIPTACSNSFLVTL